jgi:hypothetical protein
LPPPELPKAIEVPEVPNHVRAEAGMLGFTQVLDRDKVEAAIAAGTREIKGIAIYPEWKFRILELKDVPAEFKKSSNRITQGR